MSFTVLDYDININYLEQYAFKLHKSSRKDQPTCMNCPALKSACSSSSSPAKMPGRNCKFPVSVHLTRIVFLVFT